MRYKFVKKGKKPSPADVKSQMDFSSMATNAKGLVGAKLSSAALSSGITVKTIIVSSVSVAILATSSVVVYQEMKPTEPIEQTIEEAPIDNEQLPILDSLIVEDDLELDTTKLVEKEPIVEKEPKSEEGNVEENSQSPPQIDTKPQPKAKQPA